MPRLSLYRPNRTRDYQFLDRTISEMYTVGGLDIFVHKYMGPEAGGRITDQLIDTEFNSDLQTQLGLNLATQFTNNSSNFDATQPTYETVDVLHIQDLLLLENRDRVYDPDVYVMRGVYNTQDVDFDLTQFGLFLNNDTIFMTFHYNDMIDTFGRKLMNGDVIEIPNLKDYHPLNKEIPRALPRYYVIQDADFASEGFSVTWMPHLWRVKCTPMKDQQEFNTITNKPFVQENIWDPGNFYPAGTIVNYGDTYYRAIKNTPADTDINNLEFWRPYDPATISDVQGTRQKDYQLNDAILVQADVEVPLSGYDVTKFYIVPTLEDGQPANPVSLTNESGDTVDGTQGGMNVTPRADGYTMGYLTGDGIAPNGLPVTPGVSFPLNPVAGDYALRLDYMPNRLFRYNGRRWVKIEDNVRTNLNNGPTNNTLRSTFVNNTYTVNTTDQGNIPSRQSLSEILRPRADNGNQGGGKLPPKPFPPTQPGQKSS